VTCETVNICGFVRFLFKDGSSHLGSASLTLDNSGAVVGRQTYAAFGETRTSTGDMLTDRLYTGQRALEEMGIYYYNARWYDPYLNRFLSADTMVPGAADSQAYDRYSYSRNNPIKFVDPSGHYDVPSDGPPSYIENKGLYEHIEYDPFALLPQGPSLTDNGAGVLNAYMEYATQNPGATIFDFSIYVYASEFDIIVENVNCLHPPHCLK